MAVPTPGAAGAERYVAAGRSRTGDLERARPVDLVAEQRILVARQRQRVPVELNGVKLVGEGKLAGVAEVEAEGQLGASIAAVELHVGDGHIRGTDRRVGGKAERQCALPGDRPAERLGARIEGKHVAGGDRDAAGVGEVPVDCRIHGRAADLQGAGIVDEGMSVVGACAAERCRAVNRIGGPGVDLQRAVGRGITERRGQVLQPGGAVGVFERRAALDDWKAVAGLSLLGRAGDEHRARPDDRAVEDRGAGQRQLMIVEVEERVIAAGVAEREGVRVGEVGVEVGGRGRAVGGDGKDPVGRRDAYARVEVEGTDEE
jgi:hypothetical protein